MAGSTSWRDEANPVFLPAQDCPLCSCGVIFWPYNNSFDDQQPLASFVEIPRSPLDIEVSSCGQIFSLPTLTRGKAGNISTIMTKVEACSDG